MNFRSIKLFVLLLLLNACSYSGINKSDNSSKLVGVVDDFTTENDGVQWNFPDIEKIIAIGDIHGDFDAMIDILLNRKVISRSGHWIAGETHLVFVGDLVDRYKDSRLIVDYLTSLQKEALEDGGKIHALLGNHDVMVVIGDLRYVSKEEFLSFSDYIDSDQANKLMQTFDFDKLIDWFGVLNEESPNRHNPEYARWLRGNKPTIAAFMAAFRGDTPYTKFNKNRNTIIKLNDTLFVHAGVGAWITRLPLGRVNSTVRDWVRSTQNGSELPPAKTKWSIRSNNSPIWNRDLAKEQANALEVNAFLSSVNAKRVIIGHTVHSSLKIKNFYEGKVFGIDTGISRGMGGALSAIEIKNDNIETFNDIPRSSVAEHPTRIQILEWLYSID